MMNESKHRVHFKKADIVIILLCLAFLGFAVFCYGSVKGELRRLNEQTETMRQQVQAAPSSNSLTYIPKYGWQRCWV